MRRRASQIAVPGSRTNVGPMRAFLSVAALFFAPLPAAAQETTDPVTGFAREAINVASWPDGCAPGS